MKQLRRIFISCVAALGLMVVPIGVQPAQAYVVPRHAIVICQSASFYQNYDSARGPHNLLWILYYGNKVGHTPGAHPVYNGWAATFDFGPNVWGYMRIECIGGYDSW